MSGRSDEEIAWDVLIEWYGNEAPTEEDEHRALVAAGRAEGDRQGELRALEWVLHEARCEPRLRRDTRVKQMTVTLEDRIRARLREIEAR